MTTILIIPGWQDSGPEHWQSLWLKKYSQAAAKRMLSKNVAQATSICAIKVEQRDWMHPVKDDWVATLDEYVRKYDEVVLVSHSLSGPVIAHWAKEHPEETHKVKGALLVAPFQRFQPEVTGFGPLPLEPLPFKTIVAASTTDPWATIEEAESMAKAWGARLVNIGPRGHINATADMGEWPEGRSLLDELSR
ncbi:MAG: alpha/beta hydrolase [Candidatus Gracilibacteria bacterium]